MLGKFSSDEIFNGNKIFGPVIFIFYNVVIVMTMITMFISILMHYYAKTKSNEDLGEEEAQLYSFLKELFSKYFFFVKFKSEKKDVEKSNKNYVDNCKYFEKIIDAFVKKVSQVF
jgi:hypothetical protein